MPTQAINQPAGTPNPSLRRNVMRTFAKYMVPPRSPGAPLRFRPDYWHQPPSPSEMTDEQLRFILEVGGKRLSDDAVRERARTAVHEAAHIVAYILTGNPVRYVLIHSNPRLGRAGEVNASCHNHVVYEALHALMGAACELEMGRGLDRAAGDMWSAHSLIGCNGHYTMPRDDVAEVLELAREFFREARAAINFIALWVLLCMPAVGPLKGARLREIVDAARPEVLAAARRTQIIRRLNAIQARREALYYAMRESRTYPPEFLAQVRALGLDNLDDDE